MENSYLLIRGKVKVFPAVNNAPLFLQNLLIEKVVYIKIYPNLSFGRYLTCEIDIEMFVLEYEELFDCFEILNIR